MMIRFNNSILLILVCSIGFSQSYQEIIHTREFTNKLEQFGLLYFQPTELWLHAIPYEGDKMAKYDLVLVSEDDSLELRYNFQTLDHPLSLSNTPHLEFFRLAANMATNDDEAEIKIFGLDAQVLEKQFNADWGLTCEFTPKRSITKRKKGKALALFNQGHGLIFCWLFYNNQHPPPFFEMPIRFKTRDIH